MNRVLLVPDLAIERWPSMDRYAAELAARLEGVTVPTEAATLGGPRFWARYVRYPRALRRYAPDLVHVADHSYAHCLAAFPGTPSVLTVHDLHPVHLAAQHERGGRAAVRDAVLRRVVRWIGRAHRWIAISRFTADELTRLLGVPAARISVVHSGVADVFFARTSPAEVDAQRRRWAVALGGRPSGRAMFVLHVGSCAPRKNVAAAIRAVGHLRNRGLDAWMVQIGGRFGPAEHAALATAAMAGHTLQLPWVADDDLRASYAAADALAMPSRYEGFGFPVVEAMAAGLPVVSSGAGGLAEAGGDAALTAAPEDPAALAEALASVLTDRALRDSLGERGLVHARRFGWAATAAAVRRVYDLAAAEAGGARGTPDGPEASPNAPTPGIPAP